MVPSMGTQNSMEDGICLYRYSALGEVSGSTATVVGYYGNEDNRPYLYWYPGRPVLFCNSPLPHVEVGDRVAVRGSITYTEERHWFEIDPLRAPELILDSELYSIIRNNSSQIPSAVSWNWPTNRFRTFNGRTNRRSKERGFKGWRKRREELRQRAGRSGLTGPDYDPETSSPPGNITRNLLAAMAIMSALYLVYYFLF